jgi:hypothetical protein
MYLSCVAFLHADGISKGVASQMQKACWENVKSGEAVNPIIYYTVHILSSAKVLRVAGRAREHRWTHSNIKYKTVLYLRSYLYFVITCSSGKQ